MSGFWEQRLYDRSRDYGYWSPTTASANFCEEDYGFSFYIAEFINTLSNLAYVYYAFYPPLLSFPTRTGTTTRLTNGNVPRQNVRTRVIQWDVHTFTLLSIGVTSAIFHLSLQRIPQFLDETSMYLLIAGFTFELLTTNYVNPSDTKSSASVKANINFIQRHRGLISIFAIQVLITTSIVLFSPRNLTIYEIAIATIVSICALRVGSIVMEMLSAGPNDSTTPGGRQNLSIKTYTSIEYDKRGLIGTLIVLTLFATTTFTLYSGDLTVHSITFAIFIVICGFKAGSMIRKHEAKTRSRLYRHLLSAYMTLNAAFILWLIDCSPSWCASLRSIRQQLIEILPPGLGIMLGFATELHGWWHILTARAAAEFISLIRHITRSPPSLNVSENGKAN